MSYWAGIARRRLSRRSVLAGTGALTSGVVLLAACGGDDDGDGGDSAGLLTRPRDETSKAKRGGAFRHYMVGGLSCLRTATTGRQQRDNFSRVLRRPQGSRGLAHASHGGN
jgi:hypothetical protein